MDTLDTDRQIVRRRLSIDEAGEVLVWPAGAVLPQAPASTQERPMLAYTPVHLAEKILTTRHALARVHSHASPPGPNASPKPTRQLLSTQRLAQYTLIG